MKSIFLLQHSYEVEGYEDTKIIGIYSTREKAEDVIERYKYLPGFKNYSEDCFYIDEYQIDKDNWVEGFIFEDNTI